MMERIGNLCEERAIKIANARGAQAAWIKPTRDEYLQQVVIGIPNPAPYVYEPMKGHCLGKVIR